MGMDVTQPTLSIIQSDVSNLSLITDLEIS